MEAVKIMAMTFLKVPVPPVSEAVEEKAAVVPVTSDNRIKQSDSLQALHHLTSDQLLQGIVLSEVLGRPLSLRRRHR